MNVDQIPTRTAIVGRRCLHGREQLDGHKFLLVTVQLASVHRVHEFP
jgi:hypothetical protein